MGLVDDEDAVAVTRRLELRDIAQLADVVHATVGRGVDFAHVEIDPLGDLTADRALVARLLGGAVLAVECLGQDTGTGGLTDAPHAREQVGVMNPALLDRVLERADRRLLTDDVAKGLGTVLAGKRLVGHECGQSNEKRPLGRAQADLHHTGLAPYRCFLPDLTRFGAPAVQDPGSSQRA